MGHRGRVPYPCRPPANIRKILTSSAQREGWAIGRQASSADWPGSFSFLGFDSRAAADRFTVLDMDYLNYFLSAEDSECVLTHPLLGIAGRMPHRVARAPSCCWPSAAHWSLIHVWGLRIMPRCIMRSLLSFAQPGQSPNGCLLWPGS